MFCFSTLSSENTLLGMHVVKASQQMMLHFLNNLLLPNAASVASASLFGEMPLSFLIFINDYQSGYVKVSIILARYSFGIRLSSERCGFSALGFCSVSDTKETFPASRKHRRSSSQANGINRIVSLLAGNIGA